jgi:hypothetical protein
MDCWVEGIIVENQIGSEYEGKVFSRWLALSTSDNDRN